MTDPDLVCMAVGGVNTDPGEVVARFNRGWDRPVWVEGYWQGRGSFWGDVYEMVCISDQRESAIYDVGHQIMSAAWTHGPKLKCVVAESMGDPIAQAAMERLYREDFWRERGMDEPRFVALGSPLHHPVAGPVLQKAFELDKGRARHQSFRNPDDPVTHLFGRWSRGWGYTRTIHVEGDHGPFNEHLAPFYLGKRQVKRAIRGY